jgi:hypothetical protein
MLPRPMTMVKPTYGERREFTQPGPGFGYLLLSAAPSVRLRLRLRPVKQTLYQTATTLS